MNLPDPLTSSLVTAATWAWNTSLIILLPALVVLALGRWQSFPARWRSWLAAFVLIRLLLPWVPEVSWRPAWEAPLQHAQVSSTGQSENGVAAARTPQNPEASYQGRLAADGRGDEAVTTTVASRESTFVMPSLLSVAVGLWLAGVASVGAWIVYSHVVLHRLITRQRTRADAALDHELEGCQKRMGVTGACGLWVVRGLPTVAVHGWLRPVILVPEGLRERFSAEEIRGMFLHELAHVRRGDLIWGRVMLAVCALHWFNPFVWLLARRMRADAELECDRIALEKLTHTQRSHYGEALLKTLENSLASVPVPAVPFFRHTKEIQTRIQMIALPRSSAVARYAALLIAPALACLTFTTASRADDENPKPAEEKAKADGEEKKTGPRDGEEGAKRGPRDGEVKKEGPRDGEGGAKTGPRDGEGKKEGARDGEQKKTGLRDGEGKKTGPGDGETKKTGLRDGEVRKEGARDGESAKRGPRDGEKAAKGDAGETVELRLIDKGENVSIGGKTIPIGKLRGYFSQQQPGMSLVVTVDPDVPYKAVAEVMDAARDNRITNLALAGADEDGGEARKSSKER
jgi:beta-lactamase regulating signal transducer with metallopeptidase domain